jgi:hypothetical protein
LSKCKSECRGWWARCVSARCGTNTNCYECVRWGWI